MSTTHDVIISGAGPVGLMLACELALRDISVLILERNPVAESPWKILPLGLRGINTSTVELLYRRGLLDKFFDPEARAKALDKTPGLKWAGHFAGIPLDGNKLELSRWKFRLHSPSVAPGATSIGLVEEVLTERALQSGHVQIIRGSGFDSIVAETPSSVTIQATDGKEYSARWLVGCDGARSAVRRAAGIDFVGTEPMLTLYTLNADVTNADKIRPGFNPTDTGMYISSIPGLKNASGAVTLIDFDGGAYKKTGDIPKEHLQSILTRITCRDDLVIEHVHNSTSYTDRSMTASSFRNNRVLLAGDACHIHPPFGGQGMNAGFGDSANLSWKLARIIHKERNGESPDLALLDTYEEERRPIALAILEYTRAQLMALQPNLHSRAVRNMIAELSETTDGANYYLDKHWGLSQRYPPGENDCQHPVVGRSSPDFVFEDGSRLGPKLSAGRGLLLELGTSTELESALDDELKLYIDHLSAEVKESCGLAALLIRPDGFVAWASDTHEDSTGLDAALKKWFS